MMLSDVDDSCTPCNDSRIMNIITHHMLFRTFKINTDEAGFVHFWGKVGVSVIREVMQTV